MVFLPILLTIAIMVALSLLSNWNIYLRMFLIDSFPAPNYHPWYCKEDEILATINEWSMIMVVDYVRYRDDDNKWTSVGSRTYL